MLNGSEPTPGGNNHAPDSERGGPGCGRDLRVMIRNQEQARWERGERFEQELRSRVVGLWGYGGIGRETARLAKAFGMTVHVMTRSGVKPRHNIFAQAGTGDPEGVLPDR